MPVLKVRQTFLAHPANAAFVDQILYLGFGHDDYDGLGGKTVSSRHGNLGDFNRTIPLLISKAKPVTCCFLTLTSCIMGFVRNMTGLNAQRALI